METQQLELQQINYQEIWNAVQTSGVEVNIVHGEKLGQANVVHALFTFCPLYDKSSLAESGLISSPAQISDSRVANKWEADKKVVGSLSTALKQQGRNLAVTIILADKGVMLNHDSTKADQDALDYHAQVYQKALGEFCEENGIAVRFMRYQDEALDVHFPTFVNPNAEIPYIQRPEGFDRRGVADATEPQTMADLLKEYMQSLGVDALPVINKKVRETLKELIKAFGANTTFWMVAGYLAFDYKIPTLLGEGGVYLSTERFSPIFRVARLTPSLNEMARIEIKA